MIEGIMKVFEMPWWIWALMLPVIWILAQPLLCLFKKEKPPTIT